MPSPIDGAAPAPGCRGELAASDAALAALRANLRGLGLTLPVAAAVPGGGAGEPQDPTGQPAAAAVLDPVPSSAPSAAAAAAGNGGSPPQARATAAVAAAEDEDTAASGRDPFAILQQLRGLGDEAQVLLRQRIGVPASPPVSASPAASSASSAAAASSLLPAEAGSTEGGGQQRSPRRQPDGAASSSGGVQGLVPTAPLAARALARGASRSGSSKGVGGAAGSGPSPAEAAARSVHLAQRLACLRELHAKGLEIAAQLDASL